MKTSRRALLQSALLGGSAAAFCGCERMTTEVTRALGEAVPDRLAVPEDEQIDPDFHLLSRAAFGPWPGDLERLKQLGRQAWIEEQLAPENLSDTACDLRAERFESLYFSPGDAYEFRKPVLREELIRHAMLRAIYSRRQLFEVMVEFWTDHLNIDLEKGDCIYLKPNDDRDVIRKHALGNFHDLIRASATSPEMLVYLDGKSNKVRRGTQDVPNENYARELMELHTLGVHGGYTQADVREAARCLSGWTFDSRRVFALNQSEAFFRHDWHDDGEKKVLGQVITAGGGARDLDRLVEIVCSHPSTAQYLALKLCRRFVSSEPPKPLVDRVAAEFTRTKGDIKSLLRVILNSSEFDQSRGQLLKRPFKYIASALRAVAADTHAHPALVQYLNRMGQGLFQYPTPDGFPDEEAPWMGTLMWRWNFGLALAGGTLPTVKTSIPDLHRALSAGAGHDHEQMQRRWFAHLVGRAPGKAELGAMRSVVSEASDASTPSQQGLDLLGVMLASPAFQRC